MSSVYNSYVGDILYKDDSYFAGFTPVIILIVSKSDYEFTVNENGEEKRYKDSKLYTSDEKINVEKTRHTVTLGIIGAIGLGAAWLFF